MKNLSLIITLLALISCTQEVRETIQNSSSIDQSQEDGSYDTGGNWDGGSWDGGYDDSDDYDDGQDPGEDDSDDENNSSGGSASGGTAPPSEELPGPDQGLEELNFLDDLKVTKKKDCNIEKLEEIENKINDRIEKLLLLIEATREERIQEKIEKKIIRLEAFLERILTKKEKC